MKRFFALALTLTGLLGALTGCGCMDRNVSTNPGGMITESTRPTMSPMPTATHETTRPTATSPTDTTGGMAGTEATTSPSTSTDPSTQNRMR